MTTLWQHSLIAIVPAAAVPSVLAALDDAYPKDDGSPRDPSQPGRYGLPLSATGTGTPTHYLTQFPVTEPVRAELFGLGLASIPGLSYFRVDSLTGLLTATNDTGSAGQIGLEFSYGQALLAKSLLVIPPPDPEI